MKKLILILFVLATLPAAAQYQGHGQHAKKSKVNTWLSISAPRHQHFWLFIDEVLQNENPVNSIRIDNMWPDEFYIRIEMDNDLQNCIGQIIDLRQAQSYSIDELRGFYGLKTMPSKVSADLIMNLRTGGNKQDHSVRPDSPLPPSNDQFVPPTPKD